MELIFDSVEHLTPPVDAADAFVALVALVEADGIIVENFGDHDWEVPCANERAAQLMEIAATHVPRTMVGAEPTAAIAGDGYGVRSIYKPNVTDLSDTISDENR